MTENDDVIRKLKPLTPVPPILDIDELGRALDEAHQAYQRDPLQGWYHAVVALQALLKVTDPDGDRKHRHMFNVLTMQLADLARGRQPELLRKRKLQHRPPDSMETWRLRAVAVHAADLLEHTGLTRDQAHRQVIVHCKKCGFPVGTGSRSAPAAKVFAGWRADLDAGRAPREGLVTYHHLGAKTIGVSASVAPAEMRRLILRKLEDELRAEKTSGEAQKDADSD